MNYMLKEDLSQRELLILNGEMEKKRKSKGAAAALWFFTGGLGGHRYYMGDIGYAAGMTFTLGALGIWTIVDVFVFPKGIDQINDQIERDIINNLGLGRDSK